MKQPVLKDLVKGSADIISVQSGGIVEYLITDINGDCWTLSIDLTNKADVGETATFMSHYDKAIILMRWIRRAIENDTLYYIK